GAGVPPCSRATAARWGRSSRQRDPGMRGGSLMRALRKPRFVRGRRVAGVDEAGRGPLAGPVVAAAVILDPRRPIRGLADSKALTPEQRAILAPRIKERAIAWGIGWSDRE